MQNHPLLILDVSFLAHRAFHKLGELSHDNLKTGVCFGVLIEIVRLTERFQTPRMAFAFDLGAPARRVTFEFYKIRSLNPLSEDQKQGRVELYRQINLLREEILPAIGFRNIFAADGVEADDVIASLRGTLEDEIIMVSGDHDLYQLLDGKTRMYNPTGQKLMTLQSFWTEYGILPSRWAEVKALAGEPPTGDNIPGVEGVGVKTAIKYLTEQLSVCKAYHSITRFLMEGTEYQRNLALTRMPYPGTPTFELQADHCTPERWRAVADDIGAESLKKSIPMCCQVIR